AVGDSVMLASASGLVQEFPGIDVDATVSRQLYHGPEVLRAKERAGVLRDVIVVGLGTNGPISTDSLDEIRSIAGPDRRIVLVSAYAPRWWTDEVNAPLAAYEQQHRNVELANWRGAIAGQLSLLARDQIRPGEMGGRVYATTVKDALQRLAELPPLLDP